MKNWEVRDLILGRFRHVTETDEAGVIHDVACVEGRNDDELLARANLIAAAPDLLAALEAVEWIDAPVHWTTDSYMCPWCRCGFQNGHADDCPRQVAIAKARGDECPS